jgi:hypothetical protein
MTTSTWYWILGLTVGQWASGPFKFRQLLEEILNHDTMRQRATTGLAERTYSQKCKVRNGICLVLHERFFRVGENVKHTPYCAWSDQLQRSPLLKNLDSMTVKKLRG